VGQALAFYYIRPKAQAPRKPNLFSKFFKPEKAIAQIMKPEHYPSPKNSGPIHQNSYRLEIIHQKTQE
jgi:hypothetical protein